MNIVFIGAHPDDVEYACAGTILRLVAEGHNVKVIIMTDGGSDLTADKKNRIQEQGISFERIGITDYRMFGYNDGDIPVDSYSVKKLKKAITEMSADVVFTHFPNDSHQDHINTARIALSAVRGQQSLIYYNSYSSINFTPNLYINIDKYVDRKIDIINSFVSQINKYKKRNNGFVEKTLYQNQLNGYECKCSYAEGFCVQSIIN